jgi:hypothetical protein
MKTQTVIGASSLIGAVRPWGSYGAPRDALFLVGSTRVAEPIL